MLLTYFATKLNELKKKKTYLQNLLPRAHSYDSHYIISIVESREWKVVTNSLHFTPLLGFRRLHRVVFMIFPLNLLSVKSFASRLNWPFSFSTLGFVSSNSIAAPSTFDTLKDLHISTRLSSKSLSSPHHCHTPLTSIWEGIGKHLANPRDFQSSFMIVTSSPCPWFEILVPFKDRIH